MADLPPHRYRAEGLKRGVRPEVLARAATQMEIAEFDGVTAILSLRHLAHLTGAKYVELRSIVARREDPYIDLTVPKNKGVRSISMPLPNLLSVQQFVLAKSLSNLPLHPRSYAYRAGRSTRDCAEIHIGARWVIRMDLQNFFGSITEKHAYRTFKSQGYSALVSFELSRLCTRLSSSPGSRVVHVEDEQARYRHTPYASPLMGTLPQGAPTSGALANAAATPLDHDLHQMASASGFVYTRYSDDLTFSTAERVGPNGAQRIVRLASQIVASRGFRINRKKTRVLGPRTRHDVLGLVVDHDRVRLPPEYRRRIEVHIHGISTRGVASHAEARGFKSVFGMIAHIEGSIAYAFSVDPAWAHRQQSRWLEALRSNDYPA